MKKFYFLPLFVLISIGFTLLSCKKQVQSVSVVGKWYVKSYLSIQYKNNVADTIENYTATNRDTSNYYVFYEGGKGTEALDDLSVIIEFSYSVKGSNLFILGGLDRIAPTCTATRVDPFNLVLKGTRSSNDAVIVQELHLTE